MGILNVTPDSFSVHCSSCKEAEVLASVSAMLQAGADMIDVGGYSTRPGAAFVSEEEEWRRLDVALHAIRKTWQDVVISVDTFRTDVARMTVEEFGADIINDVSEGCEAMYRLVSRLHVPYILMSQQPTLKQMLMNFAQQVQQLRDFGACDIILDPGFGFGKTLEQNYEIMNEMERLHVMELPLLVGISRKSMIFKLLGITPTESLNGTTVLNTISLMKGAHILRVHDVKQAVECVRIVQSLNSNIVK
jgi:dihydropteroate synthase